MKRAMRYLRFSKDGQSNSSIEWQDSNTEQWCKSHDTIIQDTFIDAGYSAKTFDRPDFIKLKAFIEKNHMSVDYLVVNQMDRFSRDAGEAISFVKKLQMKYNIQIVSVSEGLIYDYYTPGSHFRSGLQLLLAEDDNINRAQKINSGIYIAKTREQRFIGPKAPFGYVKTGKGKDIQLTVVDAEAAIIRDIYFGFINGMPIQQLYKRACEQGMKTRGNSCIQKILTNPIYSGQQLVKPWKDNPGGIFKAKHEAIIDIPTWQMVQHKFKSPRTNVSLSDALPLRGVLHCHCGRLLTGAASRGKMGKYYYFYKCNTSSAHNNISERFASNQLNEIFHYMSLPDYLIAAIKQESEKLLQDHLKENKEKQRSYRKQLEEVNARQISLESKWINDQVNFDTYSRWHNDLMQQQAFLKSGIETTGRAENQYHLLLNKNLDLLSDMEFIYQNASTTEKQALIRMVFDNRLYYKNKIYRTPYIMEIFRHNELILKQKRLLEIDEKKGFLDKIPSSGAAGNIIEPLTQLLSLVQSIKVA